jgi:hypothetical protein
MEEKTVEYPESRRTCGQARSARLAIVLACAGALVLAACTTVQPPAEPPVARPVPPPPIIIVQPVKPEPPMPVAPPVLEPPKVNEEAEEALALLVDLQKLVLASADEQKRELAAATQALARQKSDAIRLRLGMLQSLPAAGGGDDARALATLEPIVKQGGGPTRMVAAVLIAQLGERQRAVREEKKRAEDLQQKLDALKALERSLLGRERKPNNVP